MSLLIVKGGEKSSMLESKRNALGKLKKPSGDKTSLRFAFTKVIQQQRSSTSGPAGQEFSLPRAMDGSLLTVLDLEPKGIWADWS